MIGVRQIADEAGVNLGAIHCYRGSKEARCREALERRLVPVLAERTRRIEVVAEAGAGLAELLHASHRPSLLAGGLREADGEMFRRCNGRMLFDPSPEVRAILASLLDPFACRFVALLHERCPHLTDNAVHWRVILMYGAFVRRVPGRAHAAHAHHRAVGQPLRSVELRCRLRLPHPVSRRRAAGVAGRAPRGQAARWFFCKPGTRTCVTLARRASTVG
jgi:AcrR family transcriptional regulator